MLFLVFSSLVAGMQLYVYQAFDATKYRYE